MTFTLENLPFEKNALEPYISENTLSYHYGKHHKGYVDKLNAALEKPENKHLQSLVDLEQLILESEGSVYNLAAQVWNHSFYWKSLQPPQENNQPSPEVEEALRVTFGSLDNFKEEFKAAAAGQFGSGWAWLVRDGEGGLSVISTTDAVNPLSRGMIPLITLDVWEHAYYLDYQNDRGSYIDDFLDKLINWNFLKKNLEK